PPELCPAHAGLIQEMVKSDCHFINGTGRVRLVQRNIYKREQLLHFGSDVGLYVGDASFGEKVGKYWNSDPEWMEHRRAAVDRHCCHNYEVSTPFLAES
ncbi:HB2L protein, partial [Prunella himalayana]|nr:HB2L protein [Prunella himalayana]